MKKTLKNGGTATLGKYRQKRIYDNTEQLEQWWAEMVAYTYFEIEYIDKYTKEVETDRYGLYRWPTK